MIVAEIDQQLIEANKTSKRKRKKSKTEQWVSDMEDALRSGSVICVHIAGEEMTVKSVDGPRSELVVLERALPMAITA